MYGLGTDGIGWAVWCPIMGGGNDAAEICGARILPCKLYLTAKYHASVLSSHEDIHKCKGASGARCVAEVDLLQVDISEALFADLQFFAAALPAAHHCPRSKDRILPQLEMVPAYAFDAQLEVPTFAGLGTLNGKYMHVSYLHLRLVNIRNGPVLNAARLKG